MAVFNYNYHNLNKPNGTTTSYDVQIKSTTGDIITVTVAGDPTNLSREEITQAALEQFYQETFPQRAENEKFAKLDEKLAQVDDKLKLVDDNLKAIEKIKTELETTQGALMELITQISETTELHEEDTHDDKEKVETTENTVEGGE